jgi:hypothetical protein
VELGELRSHLDPQLRVEVRQRLVHEERLRFPDHGPAHRHPLPLAAGELGRLSLHQGVESEDPRDVEDASVAFGLRRLPQLEAEAEVLLDGHVRYRV